VVPPAIAGRFDAQWRAVARDAWSTVIEKPYAGAVPATTLRAPVGQLLERLYLDRFDQLTEHIAFAGAILDAVRPQALVVGNDRWWVGQTFVRVAQRRGIPTLLVQDGLAIDKAQWSWIAADHVAAFSPAWARVLMAYGLSPDRITITGQPRFDELCTRRDRRGADSVRAARRTLALDHVACGILLATQPHQAPERVESAVRALLAVDGAHVLLRPHPTEPPGKYGRCVERNPRRVSVHAGTAIDLLVDAADIVVTEYSTVALEAAILDVPVIIVPFLGARREPQMFDDLGIVARDAEALREAARGLWPRHVSPAPRRTVDADRLYALVGPLDGRAGHRVAGLIQSLLSVRDGGAGSRPHPVGAALFA
jgi:hypothetical protein